MSKKKQLKAYTYQFGKDGEQVTFLTTKDVADELTLVIKNYQKTKVMPSGASKEEALKETIVSNGCGVALGLHLNKLTNEYELAKIEYNAATKEAKVISVEFAGKLAARAYNHLKIAFVKCGIIK